MSAPRSLAAIVGSPGEPRLTTINPSIWEGLELPKRQWLIDQWILATGTTYLTGKGSVGKSLIAQQAMTAAAVGRPFLGQPVKRVRAAYITAEDDIDELHRRQAAINEALGITMTDLDGWLHLVSLDTVVAASAAAAAKSATRAASDNSWAKAYGITDKAEEASAPANKAIGSSDDVWARAYRQPHVGVGVL